MSDRAESLFRTVFQPVRSLLPRLTRGLTGADSRGLPAGLHQNIPAINLQGVILESARAGDADAAAEMYAGIYRFAGKSVSGLPDTIFGNAAPSPEWRSALLRMDWLSDFRASGKTLHGLFALRLISAWVSARPAYSRDDDKIAALRNLAIDAAALAATQSPAAVAVAQAAILQAWQPVAQLKPKTMMTALARCIAQLVAHLASKSPDGQRTKLLEELRNLLLDIVVEDGSHVSGQVADAIALLADLDLLTQGLKLGGETLPQSIAGSRLRLLNYITMLTRPDGTLAFDSMVAPCQAKRPEMSESKFSSIAGHARLSGKDSVVFVAAGEKSSATPLQLEMHSQAHPLFWLEARNTGGSLRRNKGELICASGGSLLELSSESRHGETQKLSVFLAASGYDFRMEVSGENRDAGYDIWFPDMAKLSTTHGGAGALVSLGKLGAWQLLARNFTVAQDGALLRLVPLENHGPSNIAFKLVERSSRKKSLPASQTHRLL